MTRMYRLYFEYDLTPELLDFIRNYLFMEHPVLSTRLTYIDIQRTLKGFYLYLDAIILLDEIYDTGGDPFTDTDRETYYFEILNMLSQEIYDKVFEFILLFDSGRPQKLATHKYNIEPAVITTKTHLYDIVELISQTMTHLYNIDGV